MAYCYFLASFFFFQVETIVYTSLTVKLAFFFFFSAFLGFVCTGNLTLKRGR